jgi:hypothetical protein
MNPEKIIKVANCADLCPFCYWDTGIGPDCFFPQTEVEEKDVVSHGDGPPPEKCPMKGKRIVIELQEF